MRGPGEREAELEAEGAVTEKKAVELNGQFDAVLKPKGVLAKLDK